MAQIRLIDADELIKKMQARYAEIEKEYTYYDSYVQGYGEALDVIENTPTVEKQKGKRGCWAPIPEREISGWNPEFAGCDPVFAPFAERKLYTIAMMSGGYCRNTVRIAGRKWDKDDNEK